MNLMATSCGAVALIAVVAAAGTASAQDYRTYYTVTHASEFKINWRAFYEKAEAKTAETRKALPHTLDIQYGDDVKQRLDVYRPAKKTSRAPLFIFLHGGGFREGDRAQYGYVAGPLAAQGIVTIVTSYRLTPKNHYPDQPDDIRAVLEWAYRHAKEYGADPNRIYIGGHSAGAILSAFVSFKADWLAGRSLPANLVKGCVPISGPYDLTKSGAVAEYLPDPAARADASPLFHLDSPPPQTIVAVGSVEAYVDESRALADKIRQRGGQAELIVLEGLPHDDTAWALGNPQSPLVQAIVRMMTGRTSVPATAPSAARQSAVPPFEGLWSYATIANPKSGRPPVKIAGLFFLKQGRFVQQSLNDGEPWDRQLAQAHTGTYQFDGGKIHLTAAVGIVVDPANAQPIQLRRDSLHEIAPERSGDRLTLTFGTGTVQTFIRVGSGEGDVMLLDRGALALVDGRFLLVAEAVSGGTAAAGSGTFTRTGRAVTLNPDRWLTVRDGRHRYDRGHAIDVPLGGPTLALPDGISFPVIKQH